MDRRTALTALTGASGLLGLCARHAEADGIAAAPAVAGAIAIKLNEPVALNAQSSTLRVKNQDLHIIKMGRGTFRLDAQSHLTAALKAAVVQYANIDLWISAAVFDANGKLLGAATHKEQVERVRLGAMLTLFKEITLDFGISKAYRNAASVAISIGERDVPDPDL